MPRLTFTAASGVQTIGPLAADTDFQVRDGVCLMSVADPGSDLDAGFDLRGNSATKISTNGSPSEAMFHSVFTKTLVADDIASGISIAFTLAAASNANILGLAYARGGAVVSMASNQAANPLSATPSGSADALIAFAMGVSATGFASWSANVAEVYDGGVTTATSRRLALAIGEAPSTNTVQVTGAGANFSLAVIAVEATP